MLFDPHSQIQEEGNGAISGQPQSHQLFNLSAFTRLSQTSPPGHSHPSNLSTLCRPEEWMPSVTPLETLQSNFGANHIGNVRVSYDIYGNELPLEADSPGIPLAKPMELESIEEEELMSPDGIIINQENSDPVLGVITPLKKRNTEATSGPSRRRFSFALNRSPLHDITPVSRRRKCSYNVETTTERALLSNATPPSERKGSIELPPTRKIR